jgi:hypothetical protein
MKLSTLDWLLTKRLGIVDFRREIASDVSEYLERANIKGSVQPVRIDEDQDVEISGQHIKELAYIADAMELSERVVFGEGVSDFVAEMTDPEINGPFTVGRAKEIVTSV